MSVRDNLIAARALIDTPEKWGKEHYEPRPGCFCVSGALAKVYGVDPNPQNCEAGPEYRALYAAVPNGPWSGPVNYNDHPDTTHADIMALFDRAIEAAGDK